VEEPKTSTKTVLRTQRKLRPSSDRGTSGQKWVVRAGFIPQGRTGEGKAFSWHEISRADMVAPVIPRPKGEGFAASAAKVIGPHPVDPVLRVNVARHRHVMRLKKSFSYILVNTKSPKLPAQSTSRALMAAEFKILPCMAQFPLENPSVDMKDEVYRGLFGWRDCADCNNKGDCVATGCPWIRRARLDHYLQFYFETTRWSTPTDLSERRWALRDHHDLLGIVRLVKDQPRRRRRELIEDHFSTYGHPQPALADQKRAFDLAITVITMIYCSECNPRYQHPTLDPAYWNDGISACEFVKSRLPIVTERGQSSDISRTASRPSVGALDRVGVTVYGTDDLRKHLLYNTEAKAVYVFHFVGFLEEQLRQSCSNTTVSRSVRLSLFLIPR